MSSGERSAYDIEPFRRRMRRIAAQYLHDLAIAEHGLKGDELAVHFRTLQVVAEVAVYRVREIDWRRCRRQVDDISFRREDEYAMRKEILSEPFDELFGASDVRVRFGKLSEPGRHFRDAFCLAFFRRDSHERRYEPADPRKRE